VVESNFEKRRVLALAFMEALGRVIRRDKFESCATVQPLYKNIIGNHLYILIREVFLYKGNLLFCLEKS
jgi:hypothetical protein